MSTALVIVNDLTNKKKLSQYLQKNQNFDLQFPRNLQHSFEIAQNNNLSLIVIALKESETTAFKFCHQFKQHQQTQHVPVLLIQQQCTHNQMQIADACLQPNFSAQQFEQAIRQLTMGY